MTTEPFLINPPKKGSRAAKLAMAKVRAARGKQHHAGHPTSAANKRKRIKALKTAGGVITPGLLAHFGARTKSGHFRGRVKSMLGMHKHRPVVWESKDHRMFTSPAAKIVKKGMKVNPFGEELMMIGANPRRRVGGIMAHRKHRKHRRNPMHKFGRIFKHNPIMGKGVLTLILAGGVAAIASRMIPTMPGVSSFVGASTWKKYAAQAAVLVGGSYIVTKFLKKPELSKAVMIGSGAVLLMDATHDVLSMTASSSAPASSGAAAYERLGNTEVAVKGPYQDTLGMYETGM
jgi:hypothetical protein